MNVIEAVRGLMLDTLDAKYIESVWSQDFTDGAELPDEYKEHCGRRGIEVVSEIIAAVDSWQAMDHDILQQGTATSDESLDKSWKLLIDLKLDCKALLSVLWSLIRNGQKNKYDEGSRILSLKAGTLYLKLLAVSGSRVFHVFHLNLCLKSVNVLKFGVFAFKHEKKSNMHRIGVTRDELCANDLGERHLSVQETDSLLNELIMVIYALASFITKFPLETQQELLEEIIERLAEITRLEVNTPDFMTYHKLNRSWGINMSRLSCSGYECLKLLCSPQHGDVEDTVLVVMKHLLASVLLADHDLSFREQCTVREHAVKFVKYLVFTLKGVTHRGITVFIHHVFARIGEKAEIRQKGKETIVSIMKVMSHKLYAELVRWFFDCAHSDKASYRVLALEVLSHLLCEGSQAPPSGSIDSDCDYYSMDSHTVDGCIEAGCSQDTAFCDREGDMLHKYMLAVIFARCRDSSGIVRAKALSLLVQCMKTDNVVVCSLMNEIFVLNQQGTRNEKLFLNYKQITAALKRKSDMNPLPGAGVIIDEFKSLACDSRVNVRKAALQGLDSIMKLNRSWLTGSILKVLGSSCRDPAVSVRKEMVHIISDLLQQYPDDKELSKIWAKCVVPLILDQEVKLQESVLKVMRVLIMDNLTKYSQQQDAVWYTLPWQLLVHIVEFNLHVCFMKACEVWVKEKEIRNSLVQDVCTHVGTENNVPAWIVLYCLSTQLHFKNPLFVVEYYQRNVVSHEASVSLLVIVLEVLLACCGYLPHHVQKDMLNQLVDSLSKFSVQRELIRLNVEIAIELTYHLVESKKQAAKKVRTWTGEILQRSQIYLEDTFKPDSTKALDKDQFLCHLHTLGEVALYDQTRVSGKTFQLLLQFLSISDASGVRDVTRDPVSKALAVLTVGKLCLLNQMWAKQLIRPLLKLLKLSQDLPTVINIIHVLRDLCVRYAVMMEPHLLSLWLCLKDETVDVRLTTLMCLMELLQGDYIKFRGAMFFHLLSMLCDSDEMVVELTAHCFRDCLVVKNKNMMFEHFVDAVFHYNGYEGHEVYGKCSMSREEREKFLMKGDKFRDSRELLYGFMLENMDDEHRMLSRNNLVVKVLDGASEGQLRLDEDGENVILDALHVLNSKHIHMSAVQQEGEDDSVSDSADRVRNVIVRARNKAVAECTKKNMILNIVPAVIHLKAVLQEKNSCLVPHLMLYVRDMMKEYKNEVKEIFAEDVQMATEILQDILELEKIEKQSEIMQRRQDALSRTLDPIPSRINDLLQRTSPWVHQSLYSEISRCHRIGGDELMLRYAHSKLQHLKNQMQQRSGQCILFSEGYVQEPKQEGAGEASDIEAGENLTEECEIGDAVALAVRETFREGEEQVFQDQESAELEFGLRGIVEEEELEDMETGVAGFEMRQVVEEETEDGRNQDTEFALHGIDERGLDVREPMEMGFEF